jgi:pyruvate dehydrogenase E2 component (dihydrolipoamide acetyltransferase)
LRKVIAARMAQSWNAVPRVTQFDEADITALEELRKSQRRGLSRKRERG